MKIFYRIILFFMLLFSTNSTSFAILGDVIEGTDIMVEAAVGVFCGDPDAVELSFDVIGLANATGDNLNKQIGCTIQSLLVVPMLPYITLFGIAYSLSGSLQNKSTREEKVFSAREDFKKYGIISGVAMAALYVPTGAIVLAAALPGMITLASTGTAARDRAEKYRICLDDKRDNHPAPYTNRQILDLMNSSKEMPTVENIADKYDKLCIQDVTNNNITWVKEGDSHEGVFVSHMPGYAYVLCASVYTACPCVFNIQRGHLKPTIYKKKADGTFELDENKNLIPYNSKNSEKYAKHCRVKRIPQNLLDSPDDLPGIFDESCKDLKGYSKFSLSITSAIAQCVEGTARNIFEKPIISTLIEKKSPNSQLSNFNSDIEVMEKAIKIIKSIKEDRLSKNFQSINQEDHDLPLSQEDKDKIIQAMQDAINTNSKYQTCADGRTVASNKQIAEKYSSNDQVLLHCCINPNAPNCSNSYKIDNKWYFMEKAGGATTQIDINNFFDKIRKADNTQSDLIILQYTEIFEQVLFYIIGKKSLSNTTITSNTSNEGDNIKATYTLFDSFKQSIQIIAIFAILFWSCTFGYKLLLGEISLDTKKIAADFLLPLALVYFILFDSGIKDYGINMLFNISKSIGMAVFEAFTFDSSSPYARKCEFRNIDDRRDILPNETCNEFETEKVLAYDSYNIPIANRKVLRKTCLLQKTSYVPRPPLEAVYRKYIKWTYSSGKNNYNPKFNIYAPLCRKSSILDIEYQAPTHDANGRAFPNQLPTKSIYNEEIDQEVYVCDNGYVMDHGYTIGTLQDMGVVPQFTKGAKYSEGFKTIIINSLNKNQKTAYIKRGGNLNGSTNIGDDFLKEIVIPTTLRIVDQNGTISKIDFTSQIDINEGRNRALRIEFFDKYREMMNSNSTYPILLKYGVIRDMSFVAFFDKLDCKLMQYLTLKFLDTNVVMDGKDASSVASGVLRLDISDIFNGLLSGLTFVLYAFPFGLIVAVLMLFFGITLFILIFQAMTQYVTAILGIVVNIYSMPLIFVYRLYQSGKASYDSLIKELLGNLTLTITPFVTIAIFLSLLEFIIFGNPMNYESGALFDSQGTINKECFAGKDSEAPLACLLVKLSYKMKATDFIGKIFTFNIFNGSDSFDGATWQMFGYLMWRSILAFLFILVLSIVMDQIESIITQLFGGSKSNVGQAMKQSIGIMKTGASAPVQGIKSLLDKRNARKAAKEKKEKADRDDKQRADEEKDILNPIKSNESNSNNPAPGRPKPISRQVSQAGGDVDDAPEPEEE